MITGNRHPYVGVDDSGCTCAQCNHKSATGYSYMEDPEEIRGQIEKRIRMEIVQNDRLSGEDRIRTLGNMIDYMKELQDDLKVVKTIKLDKVQLAFLFNVMHCISERRIEKHIYSSKGGCSFCGVQRSDMTGEISLPHKDDCKRQEYLDMFTEGVE